MNHFAQSKLAPQLAGMTAPVGVPSRGDQGRGHFDSARGLAAFLLAAIVSAVLVVADQLMETLANGHLMVAWAALWAVGFAALALLGGTVRRFSGRVVSALDAWSARVAQRRADARLWAIASKDARVMADLQAALARAEGALPEDDRPAAPSRAAVRRAALHQAAAHPPVPHPYV